MAKKKKTSRESPFQHLPEMLKKAGLRLAADSAPPDPQRTQPGTETLPQPGDTDETLFARAMDGVSRARWKHNFPPSPPSPRQLQASDSESEDRRLMEAAAEGIPAMKVLDHPEYIEGWIGIAGRRFLPNLRSGMYSIQGQIDLHGLKQEEARAAVEDFIEGMSRFRSCCVKIIHGRGINSPDDRAVLKESLQRWLSTRRMARHVVAYASAPLKDGGVGAVYVLLRRN